MKKTLKMMVLMVSLAVLFTACGESPDAQNSKLKTQNLVANGSFEQGTTSPDGWHTHNQFLNDVTGWATDETRSGKHSLKIENIGGTDAYWQGDPIVFNNPTQAFAASIWTKAKDIKNINGKYQLAFDVFLKGNRTLKVLTDIPSNKTEWQQVSKTFIFQSDIVKIIPYCVLSGTIGKAWFDDLSIIQVKNNGALKILFDSNFNGKFTDTYELISNKDSEKIYKLKGDQRLYSSNFIPVNESVVYELVGGFKAVGVKPSSAYFGIDCYDKEKRSIPTHSFKYINGTETKLVKSCTPTDKFIIVKDASNWKSDPNGCIAFNVDDSGQYEDIPNFKTSKFGIEKIEQFGQFWKVYLSKEVGCNYSVGTKVREHVSTGGYLYSGINGAVVPNEWTEYKGTLSSSSGRYGYQLYPHTKYIKIVIFGNYKQTSESELQFRKIKFKEIFKQIQN